jgi:DNA polymerase elongation subunit (family B)
MLDYKAKAEQEPDQKEHYLALAQLEDVNQMTAKILINSLYGALGNAHFVLFNEIIARSITGMGRFTIRKTSDDVEKAFSYLKVIYNDTDSAYLTAEKLVEKFLQKKPDATKADITDFIDKFYKSKVDPVVQQTINELGEWTNALQPNVQGADREIIAPVGMLVTKKKYLMFVMDNEGVRYDEDNMYLKTQGLDLIKGGTPAFAKKYLKEAARVLLLESEEAARTWIDEVKEDFLNWPLESIAKTQGVSKIHDDAWGTMKNGRKVSIPFGSRTAVVTNKYIEEQGLKKFQKIQAGDKVKMLYLREPNPLKSDAFAFLEGDFAELFSGYIDYDKNFQKFFLAPLEIMTKPLGFDLTHDVDEIDDW